MLDRTLRGLPAYLLSLILLFALTVMAFAEQIRAGSYLESGRQAFEKGDYVRAELDLRKAFDEARTNNAPVSEMALAAGDLGNVLLMLGRYGESEQFLQLTLGLLQGADSPNSRYLPVVLCNLATLYHSTGRLREAEAVIREALQVGKETFRDSPWRTAELLNTLGMVHFRSGRAKKAESDWKKAIALMEQSATPAPSSTLARILANTAALHYARGKLSLAEQALLRSLQITEQIVGPEHPDLSEALSSLAYLYYTQKDLQKAEGLLRRGLTIRQKAYGPDHRDTAATKELLAQVLAAGGAYDEAETLYTEALNTQERILGPGTPEVASTLQHFADLLRRTDHEDRAGLMESRAMNIRLRLTYTVSVKDQPSNLWKPPEQ